MSGQRTDFLISHAGRDTARAEWLAWQLQQAGYTFALNVRDRAPGELVVGAPSRIQLNGNEEQLELAARNTSTSGKARWAIPSTRVDAIRVITCSTVSTGRASPRARPPSHR